MAVHLLTIRLTRRFIVVILFLLGTDWWLVAQQPGGLLATDLVMFSRNGLCPTGWTEDTAARGLLIVGLPLSGTNLGTVGTVLSNVENRAVGQHTHVQDAHGHGVTDPGHQHTQRFQQKSAENIALAIHGLNDVSSLDGALTAFATTGLTVNNATATNQNAGSVAGTNAPYMQMMACKKL